MQLEPKRLVILTRDSFPHRYVTNALCSAFDIDRIIVDNRTTSAKIGRALREGVGHFLSKAARSTLLRSAGDAKVRLRAYSSLFGAKGEAFDKPEKITIVNGVNSSECIALLKEIQPDAILVYGTSVVSDTVLRLAKDKSFNLHTGVSPYYRGTACAFWPVVNGEFDKLGATVHECTSDLDGGEIFAIAHAEFVPGDNLHMVFARAAIVGAQAYIEVIKSYLEGELKGTRQDLRIGREYRGSDLTFGAELSARARLAWIRMRARSNASAPPPRGSRSSSQ